MARHHTSVLVTFHPATLAAIDRAAEQAGMERSAFLEHRLGSLGEIRQAAAELGLDFPPVRRRRGRPRVRQVKKPGRTQG